MSDEQCGHETASGEECKNPTTDDGDPGRCWIDSHNDTAVEAGQPGRPTTLDKDTVDSITSHVAEGKSVASATRMETVPPSTFYNWLDKAPENPPADPTFDDAPYAYLLDRFVRARGHGEDAYVQQVLDIAREQGDLATLMSMLKQRYPDSWGDVDRGQQQGGVVVNVSEPDEYEVDPDSLEVVNE